MIKPVLLYNHPLISKVCKNVVDFNDPALEQHIEDLIESCVAYNGVGLAAPQIGIDLQVCVLDVENRTKKMILINPTIISYSKKKLKLAEACLSAPGLSVQIKRPESVTVDANLPTGELVRYEFTGFDARILFHEYQHLQGICISRAVQNYSIMI
jgi:peptide deformylase